MKLAYILNTYPLPSHSFIRREMQALERQGFTITRLAMRRPDTDLVDSRDRDEAERVEYVLDQRALRLLAGLVPHALSPRFWRAAALAWRCGTRSEVGRVRHLIYLAEAARVARRCTEEGVQHLHAHFGTNSTAVAMLAHALGGPTYSFTVHGPEEFDAPRALSLNDKIDRAAFAVGVSEFGRSQLRRWASFDNWDKLKVVHCGVEPAAFDAPQDPPTSPLRLVSIGRFVEQKGQMILIEALARLRDRLPELHLALVGDGEMRPDLERAIDSHGLRGMVTLTGWLDQEGVRAQLDAANALVMPSFAEGLPMVVMEAMAAARPVIATYIAGTPELVQQGKTGWLVPAGDADALAEVIASAAATPRETLLTMGEAGRERVRARHDIDTEATKLAGYFHAAASASSSD
ncbi:glycosyltransferase [Lutimaribacter marinistellae]|uniref:Glycosyltransferase n=1 Tax=Lutimaribacter marinistellae TaxID=1820329 RepID=A0ABV7TKK5_9RHOB